MDYKKGSDRQQVFMSSLDDLVARHSFARVVDLFIDALALEDLGFKHAKLNREDERTSPKVEGPVDLQEREPH